MNLLPPRFNNYLTALILLAVLAGCASSEERKKKKEEAAVELYLESEFDTGNTTKVVPIYRASPIPVRIYSTPFVDSSSLTDAAVVDVVGGFIISLKFDFHGQLALENVTTSYRGNRIVVHAEFPELRWLAAPTITVPIKSGQFTFTPDATREEAERIVNGLNNVAVTLGNRAKSGAKKQAD
jgi:hypothetical protein